MNPSDCNHPALDIEPGKFRCADCGIELERKSATEHIADMRLVLRERRKPRKDPK